MEKKKSTYTEQSSDGLTLGQNFDPQYPMSTMTEGPSNWESDWSHGDHEQIGYFPNENQNFDPLMCSTYPNPWQPFSFPGDPTHLELINATADAYDDDSEVSLPLVFSDFESSDGVEDSFPQNNYWKTPRDKYHIQNLSIFEMDKDSLYNSYYPGLVQPYNMHSRLILTSFRSASIMLRHLVSVDVSPEGAIYMHNIPGQSITVVNDSGDRACIVHPNSRVLQEGQTVHIMTHQARLAKMCRRGIVFSASAGSIVYLLDESGTKSTSGKFNDLCNDFTSDVFYGSMSKDFQLRCTDSLNMLSNATYKLENNGNDVWCVGDTQIKQDQYGNIEVSRKKNSVLVTLLPTAGEVSVRTPFFKATVGCFAKRYLNVQKGDCHVSSGFCGLSAQKGTQKAGLDRNGKVVLF